MKNRLKKYWFIVAAYNVAKRAIGSIAYLKDYVAFKRLSARTAPRFPIRWKDRYPCLLDRTAKTEFDRHYTYHPAWAARILAETKPVEHVDISSLIQFSSLISAFIPVRFYDYRPASLDLNNLTSESADLLALPFAAGSLLSVSCCSSESDCFAEDHRLDPLLN